MSNSNERPGVGIATLVINEKGKVLIGRDGRKGESKYGVPGGHWENGETIKQCAKREVKEESGISVRFRISADLDCWVRRLWCPTPDSTVLTT